MDIVYKPISQLIDCEYNPKKLSPEQYEQIKSSLLKFGWTLPGIVNVNPDRENVIIDAHQRKNITKAEYEKHGTKFEEAKYQGDEILIPCIERNLTLDQERELIIRLKKNTSSWDEELLKEAYQVDELAEMGFADKELDFMVEETENDEFDDPEIEFTDQMLLEHNYVVLYFDNPMDWEVAKEKLGLEKVKELIDVKEPTKGIGRVMEGKQILDRLSDE
ncbi:hypothetical protein [Fodinibius sp.]|uniref:hypothetical protein n=1 Tax=Fodinibius sp. TaxID=1872440 RepID=UPI002ACD7A08|nr:hypothetical protein [Fodinibius sp.]MDZ7658064.1 hypothetical protein [Fodinibius sp.]